MQSLRDRIDTVIYVARNNSGFVQITNKKLLAGDTMQINVHSLVKWDSIDNTFVECSSGMLQFDNFFKSKLLLITKTLSFLKPLITFVLLKGNYETMNLYVFLLLHSTINSIECNGWIMKNLLTLIFIVQHIIILQKFLILIMLTT